MLLFIQRVYLFFALGGLVNGSLVEQPVQFRTSFWQALLRTNGGKGKIGTKLVSSNIIGLGKRVGAKQVHMVLALFSSSLVRLAGEQLTEWLLLGSECQVELSILGVLVDTSFCTLRPGSDVNFRRDRATKQVLTFTI